MTFAEIESKSIEARLDRIEREADGLVGSSIEELFEKHLPSVLYSKLFEDMCKPLIADLKQREKEIVYRAERNAGIR